MILIQISTGETIKAVSDYGMMIVTSGTFIAISATLMWFCVKWFKSLIQNIIAQQTDMLKELLSEMRKQSKTMNIIAERLQSETLLRMGVLADYGFDLLTEKLCHQIQRVIDENHLDDREQIQRKVGLLTSNLLTDLKQSFSHFTWNNKRLCDFFKDEWESVIVDLVLAEVYSEDPNAQRTWNTIRTHITRLKNEFLRNIN